MKFVSGRLLGAACLIITLGASIFWWSGESERSARQIAVRVDEYYQQNGHFPNPSNFPLMESLGFELGTDWSPQLHPLENGEYELHFILGFDCPYFRYTSIDKKWKEFC